MAWTRHKFICVCTTKKHTESCRTGIKMKNLELPPLCFLWNNPLVLSLLFLISHPFPLFFSSRFCPLPSLYSMLLLFIYLSLFSQACGLCVSKALLCVTVFWRGGLMERGHNCPWSLGRHRPRIAGHSGMKLLWSRREMLSEDLHLSYFCLFVCFENTLRSQRLFIWKWNNVLYNFSIWDFLGSDFFPSRSIHGGPNDTAILWGRGNFPVIFLEGGTFA